MTTKLLTKEEALQVARADYAIGVSAAIGVLESLGFNCLAYWKWLDSQDIDSEDLDENILKKRDELFASLGEENNSTIQEAYDIAWNE